MSSSKVSPVLKMWFESRLKVKFHLTTEQARTDIVKNICIDILRSLPLDMFIKAFNKLGQLDDIGRLHLLNKLLYFTPNPDMVSGEEANCLRKKLVNILMSLDATTVNEPKLAEVVETCNLTGRPQWHSQLYMMHLALQSSQDYTLARDDLITTAINLDEKLSAETGLPRCFSGQLPRNSASACLRTNAGGYFTVFKKESNQNIVYYKLSFIPNDRDDAIKHYNQWTNDIIVHKWPSFFGKKKKSKTVQNDTNSGQNVVDCNSSEGPATATRNKRKLLHQQQEQEKLKFVDSNIPKKLSDIVEVRPSTIPNAGNGLFAKRDLPISTPLGFYFGVPIMEPEFDEKKDKVGKASQYSMRYKHLVLDATDDRGEPFTDPDGPIFCPFHFMNEDPTGNMEFLKGDEVNQVVCWTKQHITKGEELFVYYGGDVDHGYQGPAEGSGKQIVDVKD